MISAIDTALRRIKLAIPRFVLEASFPDANSNVEIQIRSEVIEDVVINDCNIGGGITKKISLDNDWLEPLEDTDSAVYRVPAEYRDNREIVGVSRIVYDPERYGMRGLYYNVMGNGSQMASTCQNMFSILRASSDMVDSKTGYNGGQTFVPDVKVMQGDLVFITPEPIFPGNWLLVARLAHNTEMDGLGEDAVDDFANLCIIATKMFCYNLLISELDSNMKESGMDIPAVRDVVSNWSDMYEEYIEVKNAFLRSNSVNDIDRISGLLDYM